MNNNLLFVEDFNEILIVLEAYNRFENTLLFDFINTKSCLLFHQLFDIEDSYREDNPSMVLFKNIDLKKRLRDGTYYNLKKNASEHLSNQISIDESSSIYRYVIDLKGKEITEVIENKKSSTSFIDEETSSDSKTQDIERVDTLLQAIKGTSIRFVVNNVGQGNWTEFFYDERPKIVFDFGTSYLQKKNVVKSLIAKREAEYQVAKPLLILSHWDVDHYHLLLEADDSTIRSVKAFVHRSKIPNATSWRLVNRFKSLNPSALIPISERQPPALKRSSEILEKLTKNSLGINIYNGSKNPNRNKSGILISYNSTNLVVLCVADFDYKQVQKFIFKDFDFKHDHYLVVPHHGGDAGLFTYNIQKANFKDAIISVGTDPKMSYNHPLQKVKDALMDKRFAIINFAFKDASFDYNLILK